MGCLMQKLGLAYAPSGIERSEHTLSPPSAVASQFALIKPLLACRCLKIVPVIVPSHIFRSHPASSLVLKAPSTHIAENKSWELIPAFCHFTYSNSQMQA